MAYDKLMEKVERVQRTHSSLTQKEMRLWGLKFSMGVPLDRPAEYAVVTGCRSTAVFIHLWSTVKLLRHYGIDFTFLSEENCCGSSLLNFLDPGDPTEVFQDYAGKFQQPNVDRIRDLGAKKILTVCAGCNTRYNQFQGSGELPVIHYTQLLTDYVKELRLQGEVDFYEGCHKSHRVGEFVIDTKASRALLAGIDGLVVNDIPNYCCRKVPERIFATAKTNIIVTPTNCCQATLSQRKPSDSVEVKYLTEILCQALRL